MASLTGPRIRSERPWHVRQSGDPRGWTVVMARLYAATADASARLDESREAWMVELCLPGSGALCLAVASHDRDTVNAGLREDGGNETT
jgi:hypothetical protein